MKVTNNSQPFTFEGAMYGILPMISSIIHIKKNKSPTFAQRWIFDVFDEESK
jgi:hypothetical protein